MRERFAIRRLDRAARWLLSVVSITLAALLAGCGPVRVTYEDRAAWFTMDELNDGGVAVVVMADDAKHHLVERIEPTIDGGITEALEPGVVTASDQTLTVAEDAGVADALRLAAEAFHSRTAYERDALAPALSALRQSTGRRYLAFVSVNNARHYRQYFQSVSHDRDVDEWCEDDDDDRHKRRKKHRIVTYRTFVTHNWISGFVAHARLLVIRLDDGAQAWRIYASGTYENRNSDSDMYYGLHYGSPERDYGFNYPPPPDAPAALHDAARRIVKRLNDPPAPSW